MLQLFKKRPTVATHDRWFHPDDVTAVAIISLKEGVMPKVIRTRDEAKIAKATYVVDVGGQFDPSRKLFDHHQTSFKETYANGIPLASAGLVWREYGKEICKSADVANEVAWKLIMPIDCADSGKELSEPKFKGVEPYTIFDILGHFMPLKDAQPKVLNARFLSAVLFMQDILKREIAKAEFAIESARKLDEIYAQTADKKLLILPERLSWKVWAQKQPDLLFVISPPVGDDKKWHIHTISEPGTFKSRKYLPESWAGKTQQEIASITKVNDVVFCHKNRFLAGALSREGILQLAKLAIEA